MKKTILIGMFSVVLCLGLIDVLSAQESSPQLNAKPQKWEYRSLTTSSEQSGKQLDKLGQDGWELVSVTERQVNGNGSGTSFYYFKRALAQ